MMTVDDVGEGGVKNGWKSDDVINGRPPSLDSLWVELFDVGSDFIVFAAIASIAFLWRNFKWRLKTELLSNCKEHLVQNQSFLKICIFKKWSMYFLKKNKLKIWVPNQFAALNLFAFSKKEVFSWHVLALIGGCKCALSLATRRGYTSLWDLPGQMHSTQPI